LADDLFQLEQHLRTSTSVPNGTAPATTLLSELHSLRLRELRSRLASTMLLKICSLLLGFVPKVVVSRSLPKVRDALLACKPKVHSTVLPNVPRARNFEQPLSGKARLGDLLFCSVLSNANTPKPVTDRGVSSGRKANVARIVPMQLCIGFS
jgi:hypothetical protein